MEKNDKKNLALASFAMQMLVKEDDRFRLHPQADRGFKAAIDALFSDPKLDPRAEIESLLKLGWVLESEYASIDVSDAIIAYLSKDERALAVLGLGSDTKAREVKQQFTSFAGKVEEKVEAPLFGGAAPSGSVKASSFLQPGREIRKPTKRNGQN
jgi:hypothetical protein